MNARERMLGKLRAAVPEAGRNLAADNATISQRIAAHYAERRRDTSVHERVTAMCSALTAIRAEPCVANELQWPALVVAELVKSGVKRLLLDTASAEGTALEAAIRKADADIETIRYEKNIEEWKSELFDTIDAGFCVARSGIAPLGTLIVVPDAAAPRTISLVPPLHIALVRASTLQLDMQSVAATEGWSNGMPTNLLMITGPSKTSDIQQVLAFGAHGPCRLMVVIVTDADA
ncbi:MAG TPA: LUD domain-containing protein [Rhodocyclaceae bacterium]|jgi:L-lactate dehydrogenase complex protein LldG|nr:LUD domain-containing protein [Rhodocyclaceae bacterium]